MSQHSPAAPTATHSTRDESLPADAREGPVSRRAFAVLLIAYLLVRVGLASVVGEHDVRYYKEWAYEIARAGITEAYEESGFDYPPAMLYVLYPIGKVYRLLDPGIGARIHHSPVFTLLIKLPHLVFDLLIAALLYRLVARFGVWTGRRTTPGWGRLAALAYLGSPAVLMNSAFSGQLDGIHSLLVLAAFTALGSSQLLRAGVWLAAAGLTKPLAAPMLPLLIVGTAAKGGWRGLTLTGFGGLLATVVICLPFILNGRIFSLAETITTETVGLMAFTSVNAHNLWMIAGPWQSATDPLLGPLSAQAIGVLLFTTAIAALLVRSWGWLGGKGLETGDYLARLFLLAAAIHCSFFYLSTNMHENHLFQAVPLLLAVAGRSRLLALVAAGCSIAVFLNLALHHMDLVYDLPLGLSTRSPVLDRYLTWDSSWNPRYRSYGSDLHYTWLQLVGIALNTALASAVVFGTCLCCWRRKL